MPNKNRQIVFHVRQIGFRQIVFQQTVPNPKTLGLQQIVPTEFGKFKGQFAENIRQIVLHVRQIGFRQIVFRQIFFRQNVPNPKPDFISLNETKQWISHDIFENYRTFTHHQLAHHGGVAFFLPKDVSCCEIPTFQEKTFDSIWCVVYLGLKFFILATAYIPRNAEDSIKDFFNSLENARAYAKRSNMTGVIFVGDLDARSYCGAIHVAIRVAKCWNISSKSLR